MRWAERAGVMARQIVLDRPPLYVESNGVRQFRIAVTGVGAGLVVFVIAWVLQHFLLSPLFCHDASLKGYICSSQTPLAYDVATIIAALIATAVLANAAVYRPLLVSLASAALLWSVQMYLPGFALAAPLEQALWLMLLYGLSYVLFGWILRTRSFVLSVVSIVVVVMLLRIGLMVW